MATEKTTPETKDTRAASGKAQQQQQQQPPPQKQPLSRATALPLRRGRKAAGLAALRRAREPFTLTPMEFFTNPFAMMRDLRDEMDRMLEDMDQFLESPGFALQQEEAFSPQIEVSRKDDAFVVRADLPGIKKEDVHVEITDDALRLEGERRSESREERSGYFHSERSYGRFERLIPLPEGCDTKSAQATFDNGVLEVTLKAPQARPSGRRVEIQEKGSQPGGPVH